MSALFPISINEENITLESTEKNLTTNQYIKITKNKQYYYSSIISIDEEKVIIKNPRIDNLVDYNYESIELDKVTIYNPMILGHQINTYGQIIDNTIIYSLKKPSVRKTNPKSEFFLTHKESLDKDFVYLGLDIETNLKKMIEIQTNNVQNYTFLNIVRKNSNYGLKTLKMFQKFSLEKKNCILEINSPQDYESIYQYIEYFKDGLNSNTLVILNSIDWTDQELFEFNWILNKIPKIVVFHSGQENRTIKRFCNIVISEEKENIFIT